jgi:hypothetical protein
MSVGSGELKLALVICYARLSVNRLKPSGISTLNSIESLLKTELMWEDGPFLFCIFALCL